MRVLYSFPDTVGAPGIGTTAYHQVRGLVEQGCDVTLACTHLARPLPALARLVETMTVGGRRVPHRALGVRRAYARHDHKAAGLVNGHDIVHTWPQATLATAEAASVPVLREVPNTHTAHAYEVVGREVARLGLEPERGHSHTYDEEVLRLEEREYELADFLLVPSAYARGTFLERGFAGERLLLHRYGFDPAEWPAPGERGERPFTAVFAGRGEPRKGLHLALEAWARAGAPGRLLVCGEIEPAYRRVLAVGPGVELLGHQDDLGAVLRESDVLLLPSLEEGSALVTYEAQASGCALLVSDAAGARCAHGRHGFVHRAGDVDELTPHLRRLVGDETLLVKLHDTVLAERDRLTWTDAAKELLARYETAVRG